MRLRTSYCEATIAFYVQRVLNVYAHHILELHFGATTIWWSPEPIGSEGLPYSTVPACRLPSA